MSAVSFYRKSLAERLCGVTARHDAFLAETAWISDPKVMDAMAGKCLGIVVQNRPMSARLRDRHTRLLSPVLPQTVIGVDGPPGALGEVRVDGTPHTWDGGFARGAGRFFMHRKGIVLGSMRCESPYFAGGVGSEHWVFTPEAVWTGSYNMTVASRRHREHVAYVQDPGLAAEEAAAFYAAYLQATPLSEACALGEGR